MEINRDDYFNQFDKLKGYRQLAYIAGRPLQSAELNEAQSIILDLLSSVGKYLISNGTILSGGEVTSLSANSITINQAVLSIEGLPTIVDAGTVALASGTSIFGAAVKEVLITGAQDKDILEPDPESPHYQGDGAYRVQVKGTWKTSTQVAADEVFFPVMTIIDGVIAASQSSTDTNNAISKAISRYDEGVHGSYIVNGCALQYRGIEDTTNNVLLSLSSGTARVAGNEKVFPVESTVKLEPISDVRSVLSEPIVFVTGTKNYALRNTPVRGITKVSATKSIKKTITRGASSGGTDLLPNTPVLQITEVKQGGTTYVRDVDYKQSGDTIDWSLSGAEPSPGSTYDVTWQYIANFAATTNGTNVVLADSDAQAMVNNSTMYVDYDFYLSRIDRILISSAGDIVIQKGAPTLPSQIQAPRTPNGGFLSLATVTLTFGQQAVIDQGSTVFMMPFSDMQTLKAQMADMQYNVALLSLKDTANSSDPVTNKRGIIVDPLLNENMRDEGVSQTLVIMDQTLQMRSNMSQMAVNADSNFMLDIAAERELINQPYRTKQQRINPYAGNGASMQADINLAPGTLYGNTWWSWWHGSFMPRDSVVQVSLARFSAGEKIDVYFRGAKVGQATADAYGAAKYQLTVPTGTYYGNYEVSAIGVTSKATCKAILTCRRSTTEFDGNFNWNGQEIPQGYDPVAQTFVMSTTADVSAVSIYLKELPTNALYAKIVPTIVGIPDSGNIIGLGSLAPSQCSLGWQKIPLKIPVTLQQGQEYAVIIATANYQGQVATARVGEYDNDNKIWIQNQASNGVLLLSSNERTWTPVQDEDLCFKIHAVTYTASKTVKLLTMSNAVDNTTELQVTTDLNVPAGTNAVFTAKVGSVEYELGVNKITQVPAIPKASGDIELYVKFTTSNTATSPKLLAGVGLYSGVADTPADYVQRSFNINGGSTSPAKIQVILDQYAPSGSTIQPYYKKTDGEYQAISQKSSVDIGNGWKTVTYEVSNVAQNSAAIKLTMTSSNYAARPLVKNIRTLVI